jgi:small subunit ribosomal protein S18
MARNKLKISSRLLRKKIRKQAYLNPKHCRFCGNVELNESLNYKNIGLLRGFLTERSKILPSRVSGNCSYHQRQLAKHIKIARSIALLPFCATLVD